ncbi:MAG: hypothetical protein HC901_01165 [Bdellovibrionaceae bacterium]|nr:hypothetical protein [Pseudobdellovibrionaceae bacterium]
MITAIVLLTASIVIQGAVFVWAMCRAARLGDEAMEAALREARKARPL